MFFWVWQKSLVDPHMGLATMPDPTMVVRPKTLGSDMVVRLMTFVGLIFLLDPNTFARPKYLGSGMVVSTKLDPRH
jgi:hypothetical protein